MSSNQDDHLRSRFPELGQAVLHLDGVAAYLEKVAGNLDEALHQADAKPMDRRAVEALRRAFDIVLGMANTLRIEAKAAQQSR